MKDNFFKSLFHQTSSTENFHDDMFEMTDTNPTHPEKGWPGQKETKKIRKSTPRAKAASARTATTRKPATRNTGVKATASRGTAKTGASKTTTARAASKTTSSRSAKPVAKTATSSAAKTTVKATATRSPAKPAAKRATSKAATAKKTSGKRGRKSIEPGDMNDEMLLLIGQMNGTMDQVSCGQKYTPRKTQTSEDNDVYSRRNSSDDDYDIVTIDVVTFDTNPDNNVWDSRVDGEQGSEFIGSNSVRSEAKKYRR